MSDVNNVLEFTCDCAEHMRSACNGEPFFEEHKSKRYCALHFPGKNKVAAFNEALERKRSRGDYDFRGIFFPDEVVFSTDSNKEMDFSEATFCGETAFMVATYDAKVDFTHATFNANAVFYSVTFKANAVFDSVTFNAGVDFSLSTFEAMASFLFSRFKDQVRFARSKQGESFIEESWLNLQEAIVEKPERFTFDTLTLRPYFFLSVDAHKFDFVNVKWRCSLREELERIPKFIQSPHRRLSRACRHLAVNAEENHRYEEASEFRYMAMDARRREKWHGFAFWNLYWWYWAASGYGERVLRALLVLGGVWLLFAFLYLQVGFARIETMSDINSRVSERSDKADERQPTALMYSLALITLQKPEPRPPTPVVQMLVTMETIIGPLQGALLALAVRRKFMR